MSYLYFKNFSDYDLDKNGVLNESEAKKAQEDGCKWAQPKMSRLVFDFAKEREMPERVEGLLPYPYVSGPDEVQLNMTQAHKNIKKAHANKSIFN